MSSTEEWASDWANTFAQDWDSQRLESYVGKTIKATTPDGSRGFSATVVGYSTDTIVLGEGRKAYRHSFLTTEGLQVSIYSEMQVEELPAE